MPADKSTTPPSPQNTDPKISEKSTKSELWAAYNQLLAQLEGRPVEPSPELQAALANDPSRSLAELKLKLSQQLDAISEDVLSDLASLANARRAIQLERRRLLETQTAEQEQLAAEITKVRRQWEQENLDRTAAQERERQEQRKMRQREDDDYNYNVQKSRRSEEDAYAQKHAAREATLQAREQAAGEREQHLAQIETEASAWPKRLDDAVATARAELSKEIGQQHTVELRELKLIHQHEASIAAVKTQGLEQQLKSQAAEIDSLKRQLTDASRQLKDMAVTVIEARSSEYRTAEAHPAPGRQAADSGRGE
jgi:hypothetical protein